MRWGYVIPRILIVAAIWSFFTFSFDPMLRSGAVSSGQLVFGAAVDVENVQSGFFPPSVQLGKTAIANRFRPGENLLEFTDLKFKLEGDPLLRGAFHIKNAELHGLRCGTPRGDLGQVPITDDDEARRKALEEFRQRFKQLGKDWLNAAVGQLENMLDPKKLQTVKTAESLDAEWRLRFKSFIDRGKALEARTKRLEPLVKSVTDNRDVIGRINSATQLLTEADLILREFQAIRLDLQKIGPLAKRDFTRLDQARRVDYENAKKVGKLLSFDGEAISETLLGEEAAEQLTRTMKWVNALRKQVDGLKSEPEKKERFRGEDIVFAQQKPQPQFVIETLAVSGEFTMDGEPIPVTGRIHNLTSDPALFGKPTEIHLSSNGRVKLTIDLTIDQTKPTTRQHLRVRFEPPESQRLRLGEDGGQQLVATIGQTVWMLDVVIQDDKLDGKLDLNHRDVALAYEQPADSRASAQLVRILQSTLDGVNSVDLKININGTTSDPVVDMESDLGRRISIALNNALVNELDAYRARFAQQVDAAAVAKIQGLQTRLRDEYSAVLSMVKLNEDQVNVWKQKLPTQQLPGRLQNELQNQLQDKLQNELQNKLQDDVKNKLQDKVLNRLFN